MVAAAYWFIKWAAVGSLLRVRHRTQHNCFFGSHYFPAWFVSPNETWGQGLVQSWILMSSDSWLAWHQSAQSCQRKGRVMLLRLTVHLVPPICPHDIWEQLIPSRLENPLPAFTSSRSLCLCVSLSVSQPSRCFSLNKPHQSAATTKSSETVHIMLCCPSDTIQFGPGGEDSDPD